MKVFSWMRKNWWLTGGILFLVGGVGIFSLNLIMNKILHARPEVMVPNIEGKNMKQAQELLAPQHLTVEQDSFEFDDSLPAGTIVRQHPPFGMKVRAGRVIRVVVSRGGEEVMVPDVMAKSVAEAQSVLMREGLPVGAVNELYSVDVEVGVVFSQNPSSGTIVAKGTLVDMAVSKGLPPAGVLLVPDFKNQLIDVATEWARNNQIKIKFYENPLADGLVGTILAQDPPPHQPIGEGEMLKITVKP